jgi:hypothetical protein
MNPKNRRATLSFVGVSLTETAEPAKQTDALDF